MRKFVKLALCGLVAAAVVSGCTKKQTEPETTTTATESTAAGESGVVKKLGKYKGVEVEKASTEVTDAELEERIKSILDANPEYIQITDRAAANGDLVDIDYVGLKDGVAFDGGTASGQKLELGSGQFIDGFEEGLVGANTGDELSLNLTFPADYGNAELAGQAVVFDVTVNKIEEVRDAVLDDNFVQRMSDFTTVDEFREDTRADLLAEKEAQATLQLENDALAAALENSEFELDQTAVDTQYESQVTYFTSMVQAYGMTMTDYASMNGMTEEEFLAELRTSAERGIKQQLLAKAIAEAEGMTVEDADRQIVADEYASTIEDMNAQYGAAALDETALMYKVVYFIRDNAVVK